MNGRFKKWLVPLVCGVALVSLASQSAQAGHPRWSVGFGSGYYGVPGYGGGCAPPQVYLPPPCRTHHYGYRPPVGPGFGPSFGPSYGFSLQFGNGFPRPQTYGYPGTFGYGGGGYGQGPFGW